MNTVWSGPQNLSPTIDENAEYAFTRGGCMGLAVALAEITHGEIVLMLRHPLDPGETEDNDDILEAFCHAVVRIDGTLWDIEGQYEGHPFLYEWEEEVDPYLASALLDACPEQDPEVCDYFALELCRKYGLTYYLEGSTVTS